MVADQIDAGAPVGVAAVFTAPGVGSDAIGVFAFGNSPDAGRQFMVEAARAVLERDSAGAPILVGKPVVDSIPLLAS